MPPNTDAKELALCLITTMALFHSILGRSRLTKRPKRAVKTEYTAGTATG